MPVLPSYNSNRNINANVSEPLRQEAEQPFKDQQQIIGTVQAITKQWSDANDVMQYTEAKAKYGTAVADIQSRAAADPDFKNSDKYLKELDQAKKLSMDGISNKQVAGKLGLEFDYENSISAIKITSDSQKKQLAYNKVMVNSNLNNLINNKINSATPAEKEHYELQIKEILANNISTGTLSLEEADTMTYKATKLAYENVVYTNPEKGLEILKDAEDLTPEDKYKLKTSAQQIKKNEKEYADWQLKQTQTQGVIELSDALYNNSLDPVTVRDMQQKGLIDAETAAIFDSLAVNKKYDIPTSTSLGQPEYFLRLLESAMGEETKVEKVLKDAAKAYGDGKLGVNQYRYFIENAKETFERQKKGIFTKSKEQLGVKSAIQSIKDFASSFFKKSTKPTGDMTNKFFDRYKPGDDPSKVKNEIINEAVVSEKPEISNIPAEGKIMVDKNGNRARVFPDGHYEEVK